MKKYYKRQQVTPHPVLVEAMQVAPNQIMFSYDQRTDLASAMAVTNYWIRGNAGPVGIASLDMDSALSSQDSVRPGTATIAAADSSKMRFVMMFAANTMPGVVYILLPCFVNLEGMTGYGGGNWGPLSRNVIVGM